MTPPRPPQSQYSLAREVALRLERAGEQPYRPWSLLGSWATVVSIFVGQPAISRNTDANKRKFRIRAVFGAEGRSFAANGKAGKTGPAAIDR